MPSVRVAHWLGAPRASQDLAHLPSWEGPAPRRGEAWRRLPAPRERAERLGPGPWMASACPLVGEPAPGSSTRRCFLSTSPQVCRCGAGLTPGHPPAPGVSWFHAAAAHSSSSHLSREKDGGLGNEEHILLEKSSRHFHSQSSPRCSVTRPPLVVGRLWGPQAIRQVLFVQGKGSPGVSFLHFPGGRSLPDRAQIRRPPKLTPRFLPARQSVLSMRPWRRVSPSVRSVAVGQWAERVPGQTASSGKPRSSCGPACTFLLLR